MPSERARSIVIAIKWAVLQTGHEWRVALCFTVALAAVLGPMLVLFGLKFGIVDSLTRQLVEDPRNREIIPLASGRFDPAWFATLKARPETGFLVPRTRQIAGSLELRRPDSMDAVTVEMVPTADGDPLIPAAGRSAASPRGIWLSSTAASRIKVAVGQEVDATVTRILNTARERATVRLAVVGILPETVAREVALLPLELVTAAEDYRDGRTAGSADWAIPAAAPSGRTYSGFRLYARSIFDVMQLEAFLAGQKIEVRTRSEDIARVITLDRNLSLVFRVVALIGGIGFVLSIGANLWTSVEANRRELSVLRLVGLPTSGLVLFPIVTALLIAAGGTALAALTFLAAQFSLNQLFADALPQGAVICRLTGTHLVIATLLTITTSTLVAALGGWRAAQIQPSEGIRDV